MSCHQKSVCLGSGTAACCDTWGAFGDDLLGRLCVCVFMEFFGVRRWIQFLESAYLELFLESSLDDVSSMHFFGAQSTHWLPALGPRHGPAPKPQVATW